MRSATLVVLALACLSSASSAAPPDTTPVGLASVDITPSYPVRLNGYGNRKTESEGVESRLSAKALAIGDDAGAPVVLLAVDNCGVPAKVTDEVAARLKRRAGLARERFVVCSSHTHCGPCLAVGLPFLFGGPLGSEEQGHIDRYTRELTDALEKVALKALANRKPARLAWGQGKVGFAANRRVLKAGRWTGFGVNPDGPVDHSLPVLRITDPEGKVLGVVVGYACHCTTIGGEFNKVCGEWSGYAAEEIERDNPGATALVVIGCGADANPEPRGGPDVAKRHGTAVAREVARVLTGSLTPLPGKVDTAYRLIDLPFARPPSREQFALKTKTPGSEGYFARVMLERLDRGESLEKSVPYPVQVWSFGDALALVFLGGEVVVDYALRLKKECDAERLWVVAYSNDVPCYIASKRLIGEGGYEVDGSMIYYGRPTRLALEAEDLIIGTVHDLLPDRFDKSKP
jgi:neutral ceramidase